MELLEVCLMLSVQLGINAPRLICLTLDAHVTFSGNALSPEEGLTGSVHSYRRMFRT